MMQQLENMAKIFYHDASSPSYTLLDNNELACEDMEKTTSIANNLTPEPVQNNAFEDNERLKELFTHSYGRIFLLMIVIFVYSFFLAVLSLGTPRTEGYFTNYLDKAGFFLFANHLILFVYSTEVYLGHLTRKNGSLTQLLIYLVSFLLATITHLVGSIWPVN